MDARRVLIIVIAVIVVLFLIAGLATLAIRPG
jgi:hypothetical protein